MDPLEHLKGPLTAAVCQRCGICCACSTFVGPGIEEYIPVSLLPHLDRKTRVIRVVPVRQLPDSPLGGHILMRCPAFEGEVGLKAKCTVYEERFDVCRTFMPGGDNCKLVVSSFLRREALLRLKEGLLNQTRPGRSEMTGWM